MPSEFIETVSAGSCGARAGPSQFRIRGIVSSRLPIHEERNCWSTWSIVLRVKSVKPSLTSMRFNAFVRYHSDKPEPVKLKRSGRNLRVHQVRRFVKRCAVAQDSCGSTSMDDQNLFLYPLHNRNLRNFLDETFHELDFQLWLDRHPWNDLFLMFCTQAHQIHLQRTDLRASTAGPGKFGCTKGSVRLHVSSDCCDSRGVDQERNCELCASEVAGAGAMYSVRRCGCHVLEHWSSGAGCKDRS